MILPDFQLKLYLYLESAGRNGIRFLVGINLKQLCSIVIWYHLCSSVIGKFSNCYASEIWAVRPSLFLTTTSEQFKSQK